MLKTIALGSGLVMVAGWSYLRHIQLPAGPSRMHWGQTVFGHRGCRFLPGIIENTMPAFEFALAQGAKGVELDVRLTKDEKLVVFHDAFANGHLLGVDPKTRIDALTLVDLKALAFANEPTGAVRVPTLEEVILFCRERNVRMLIELKELVKQRRAIELLLELFRRYPEYMYSETTVIAFSPGILYKVRAADRKIATGQIHSGRVVTDWIEGNSEPVPALFRLAPGFWNVVIDFVQARINPWLSGVSVICPRYTLYSEASRRKWHRRRIAMYLWGFAKPEQCTPEMRVPGVFVACDDSHGEYYPPKVTEFDPFGDKAAAAAAAAAPRIAGK